MSAGEPELFVEPAAAEASVGSDWMFEQTALDAAAEIAPAQPSLLDEDMDGARVEPLAAETHSFTDVAAVDEEPLFPTLHHDERRQQKGGWLSLFGGGRPRYETPAPTAREATPEPVRERPAAAPVAQARTVSSAQVAEEPKSDEGEDLNIPSFLRRLAN
jgi:cell division protein FtsZ